MNEKLKELAKQSGFYFYDLHDIDGQDLGESVEADSWSAIDKFAELIIQECGNVLDIGCSHPYNSVMPKLKDHFGV